MSKKQTATQWLIEHINSDAFIRAYELEEWIKIFEQAKEMEKEQIKDAWLSAWKDSMIKPMDDKYYIDFAEEYYNETYTQ